MKINFKDQILPHLYAVVVFLILVVVFYQPVFFENKSIYQNDLLQWEGGAKELLDYREKTGEEGFWSNSMFGGMPAYLVNLKYSGDLLQYVYQIITLGLPHPANQTFMALLSFYILLLVFGVRPYLAIVGAVAFGFSSFNIINIEAGHNSKGWAIAYMGLVMAGIHLAFTGKKMAGFILTALAMGLHLRVNHLQITYYLLFIVLIYGLVLLVIHFKNKQKPVEFFKTVAVLSVAVIIALGANFGRIWGVYQYGEYSTRGPSALTTDPSEKVSGLDRDYVFAWSNSPMETFTLLIPNFRGGASGQEVSRDSEIAKALRKNNIPEAQISQFIKRVNTYWGPLPFTSGPIYAGAIICFLFILAIFTAPKRYVYWLVAATLISFILSWGKHFPVINYFLYDYLPGYSKFRSVSMAITIALFSMPLLGFIGLERMFQLSWNKKIQKDLFIAFGITAGFCLLAALFGGIFSYSGPSDARLTSQYPNWLLSALRDTRESLLRADAFRSFFFISSTLVVIFFYLKGRINERLSIGIMSVLVLLDLWAIDRRFLNDENYSRNPQRNYFQATEADQFILQDPSLSYRVYNIQNPFNEARTSYHHQSVGGYHGAKLGRYQDMIDRYLGNARNQVIAELQSGQPEFDDFKILNMLNAKYIIAGSGRNAVIKNKNALGNAWFIEKVIKVNSPNEAIDKVGEIDPATTAVINASEFDIFETNFNPQGKIELVDCQPNYLKYTCETPKKAFAVFSEIYYPEGWQANIDGKPAQHVRVNYILRGMEIPAGEHVIEFEFELPGYSLGNTVTMIFSVFIILLSFAGLVVFLKKG